MNRKSSGHFAKHGVLTDKANDLEKPMLENVTLLYVSGSADGKTDFFLFAVDSLSVWEEALFHTFPSLRSLRLNLSSACLLSLREEAAAALYSQSRARLQACGRASASAAWESEGPLPLARIKPAWQE